MKHFRREITQIVTKLVLFENAGILGIKAEHQPYAKHIEFMLLSVVHVSTILLFQFRIDVTNKLSGLSAYFDFLIDMRAADVLQELHPVIFIRQVFQAHRFVSFRTFTIEVVNMEFIEVTSHNPVRTTFVR